MLLEYCSCWKKVAGPRFGKFKSGLNINVVAPQSDSSTANAAVAVMGKHLLKLSSDHVF